MSPASLAEAGEVTAPSWQRPGAEMPALYADDVHVWRVDFGRESSRVDGAERTLSPDELARARRFRFPRDRERFVSARVLLRELLARYLHVEAGRLRFRYGELGKPALASDSGADAIRFNLSHSESLALFAVTRGREIGVDVERLRRDLPAERLARRFFSPREIDALLALPQHQRQQAFFACWTRKEAYVKARGDGLAFPLDQFDVALVPGEPVASLRTDGDPEESARWSLQQLDPGPDYVAALAVEGHQWRLRCWEWR